jgi:DNA-binding MarR family transcriptional regulator
MRKPLDPLGHPAREEIIMALEAMGELTPAEVERALPADCDQATTAYHLAVLERAELIERVGGVYRLRR